MKLPYHVPTVGISFYINDFMDFLKKKYSYLHFTDHETEHQRGKVFCLRLSSSSVVKLEFELGQVEPFFPLCLTAFPWAGPQRWMQFSYKVEKLTRSTGPREGAWPRRGKDEWTLFLTTLITPQ